MAIVYAVKSGNWSDTTVWNTGSLPTSADDVRSNTFTVTVDGSYTVLSVSNKSETSPVVAAGGTFLLTNGITLTCTASQGVIGGASSSFAVTFNLASPNSATIVANCYGFQSASITSAVCVLMSGSGTLNIIGNVFGGGNSLSNGLTFSGSGTVNITGNVYNQFIASNSVYGVQVSSNGTLNITGIIFGGVTGGSFGATVVNASSGTVNVVGTVIGGEHSSSFNAIWPGVSNTNIGTVYIVGTVIGGRAVVGTTNGHGVQNTGSGSLTIIGSLIASQILPAVGGGSVSQVTLLTGPFIANALYGIVAVSAHSWRWASNTVPTYMSIPTSYLTQSANLYTTDSVSVLQTPANNNVRSGVVYGPLSEYTGTMAVPDANTVAYGVPVGNTTGTILMDANTIAEYVWNHPTANIVTSGTIGMRLKNAATIEAVGDQVEALS